MKERTTSYGSSYRYGFNNQEQDAEMGEYYAFEYRIHDARIGRFLSVDPLAFSFPNLSLYQFASNNVILSIDIEGLESSAGADPSQTASNTPVNKTKINLIVSFELSWSKNTEQLNQNNWNVITCISLVDMNNQVSKLANSYEIQSLGIVHHGNTYSPKGENNIVIGEQNLQTYFQALETASQKWDLFNSQKDYAAKIEDDDERAKYIENLRKEGVWIDECTLEEFTENYCKSMVAQYSNIISLKKSLNYVQPGGSILLLGCSDGVSADEIFTLTGSNKTVTGNPNLTTGASNEITFKYYSNNENKLKEQTIGVSSIGLNLTFWRDGKSLSDGWYVISPEKPTLTSTYKDLRLNYSGEAYSFVEFNTTQSFYNCQVNQQLLLNRTFIELMNNNNNTQNTTLIKKMEVKCE